MSCRSKWVRAAVMATALGFCGVRSGLAQLVFQVDSTLDQLDDDVFDGVCHTAANTCTLRAAVMQANRASGLGATIRLPAGTFALTRSIAGANGEDSGDLNLTAPAAGNPVITIAGSGPASTIIDANFLDRVLQVDLNRTARIVGVTLRNGFRSGIGVGAAGGIQNDGDLTIEDCVIRGSTTETDGGGIYNAGALALIRSEVFGNSAIVGGGIYDISGMDIRESTIQGNAATSGGGIFTYGAAYVANSTIADNHAAQSGGGVVTASVDTASVRLYNCTIFGNEADSDGDFDGEGAGIYTAGSTQIFNLINSVVAGNYLSGAPVYEDCVGNFGSYGRNRFGTIPAGCVLTQNGAGGFSLLASLGELGPLGSHGGPTQTVSIVSPSSLIDGAEPTLGCRDRHGNVLPTDQRGGPRTAGSFCDLGAFEYGALPAGLIFADNFESGTTLAW